MLLNRTFRSSNLWKTRLCIPSTLFRSLSTGTYQKRVHERQTSIQFNPFGLQSTTDYDAETIAMQKRERIASEHKRGDKRAKKRKFADPEAQSFEGTNEEVLAFEVRDLLQRVLVSGENGQVTREEMSESTIDSSAIVKGTELELEIVELSSTGDGLAYAPSHKEIIAVPFSVPGDTVRARVYKTVGSYSHADFVEIVKPSPAREGVTPGCKYFARCSGCQFQMISYDQQLIHKRTIVEKAYKYFSGLSPDQYPAVRDTMGSPLQYGYRTKLTPHFDGPWRKPGQDIRLKAVPDIGFNLKGKSQVLDIESCPIGTEILQEGLKLERAKVAANFANYRSGATILLRESTQRESIPLDAKNGEVTIATSTLDSQAAPTPAINHSTLDTTSPPTTSEFQVLPDGRPSYKLTFPTHTETKTYTSNEKATSTEYIGQHKFTNQAGSFFQNNNSILGPFTSYIHEQCTPPSISPSSSSSDQKQQQPPAKIKYLLDAYCGSGLFTITLSNLFTSALGIDIDRRGIEAARINAESNNIPNAGFIEADASDLFADVPYPPDQSLVVIDPPRKGASEDFLRQLCQFGAKRVVYVSCNVHTQARDVGMIVRGFGEGKGCRYEVESLRGFDFFPQTGHVEGVAVLNRVDEK